MPVILAEWEVEIRRIVGQVQPGQKKVLPDPIAVEKN
jgi:hypothetical protein